MTPSEHPAPVNYLREAFFVQYNPILLFGAVAFSLASASAIPLAAGAMGEVLWLFIGPRLPVFRRWVDSRAVQGRREELDQAVLTALEGLDRAYAARVLALGAAVAELGAQSNGLDRARHPELENALLGLEAIRPAFVRLCQLHQRLTRFLSENPEAGLSQEIARLSQSFAGEKDFAVRIAIRQALTLAERRLEHRNTVVGTRRAAELRLETIEKSLTHLRAQGLALRPPAELVLELRNLGAQLEAGAALEAQSSQAPGGASSVGPNPSVSFAR